MLGGTGGYRCALALMVAWGCRSAGSDTTRLPCPPGSQQSCVGESGCIGTRICADSGESSSECDCVSNGPQVIVIDGAGGRGPDGATDGDGAGVARAPPASSGSPSMVSTPPRRSCMPGSQRSCIGENDCTGIQLCDAPGAMFSECVCDPALPVGRVGASCNGDVECGEGLTCELPSSLNGAFATGGPQGGYCTAPCETNEQCSKLDPLAACYAQGGIGPGPGYCLKTCSLEPGASEANCERRRDLACAQPATDVPSFCAPVCDSHADCGDRYCDLASGSCSPFPPEGERAIGAPCGDPQDCAGGWCISVAGQRQACSGICIYNGVGGCGFARDAAVRGAACLNPRSPELPGDLLQLGWCSQLCDEDRDCTLSTSGWFCAHWPAQSAAALVAKWGRSGACIQPSSGACSNDCDFAYDGFCDDGGADSATDVCELSTDCADCGPRL